MGCMPARRSYERGKRHRGEGRFCDPRPGGFFKSLQHLRRTPEGEAGLFEGIDDLFDAGFLVIESDNRDVGELIDLGFIRPLQRL